MYWLWEINVFYEVFPVIFFSTFHGSTELTMVSYCFRPSRSVCLLLYKITVISQFLEFEKNRGWIMVKVKMPLF